MNSETLAALAGAVGGAILTFAGDLARRWWYRPRLEVRFDAADPVDAQVVKGVDVFCLRVRVANTGRQSADNVVLVLKEVQTFDKALQRYVRNPSFLPMNLTWTHRGTPQFDSIPAGVERHCNILQIPLNDATVKNVDGRVVERKIIGGAFNTEVLPVAQDPLEPGEHRLTLIAAASNSAARSTRLDLELPGLWRGDRDLFVHAMRPQLVKK